MFRNSQTVLSRDTKLKLNGMIRLDFFVEAIASTWVINERALFYFVHDITSYVAFYVSRSGATLVLHNFWINLGTVYGRTIFKF